MSKSNQCKHKWKYLGFYNGAYYNTKQCIHCNKLEIQTTKKFNSKKSNNNNIKNE